MNILKKIKNMFNERFTLVVVPHNGKSTKQFKLFKPIIYFTVTFFTVTLVFFVTATIYLFNNNTLLEDDLYKRKDEINNLNLIVERQHTEIEDLKHTSKFVIDKLSQLYDLENKIRNMVGLSSTDSDKETPVTSRALSIFSDAIENFDDQEYYDLTDLTDTESVDSITSLIESQRDNYGDLIKDVEKQLKYLDAKPDMWPVTGRITSAFGYRKHPISKRRDFHKGIDIANKSGTEIVAAGSGIVTYSGWNGNYGKVIIIDHGYGYKTAYAHNKNNIVKVGDRVKKGQPIAELGSTGRSTGPHVHFEIRYNGQHIDPIQVLDSK